MTAKMHYKSKNHEKKIRKWLIDYAEKSGEPLHARAQASGDKKPEVEFLVYLPFSIIQFFDKLGK